MIRKKMGAIMTETRLLYYEDVYKKNSPATRCRMQRREKKAMP